MFELIPTLRLWDILDILIVAFLIYRVLLLIKGTRAGEILLGLGLLFFMFWIADRFEIRTLRALLAMVFDNLFIIFVLLFQNDIRRALSQVGRTSFLSPADSFKDMQLLEELIRSCVSLSNKKIGALIVIERQANVLDFVEPGTALDAQLTKEILTSIFLPVSPLHDGAAVIRNGRIHMAGCFLPLTLNPMVSKSVGTRHRAAVGLTEETDAVCIVVSEENGTISFAAGGKITHNLDAAQLRRALLEAEER
ncbi:MAG: diadenylate cyclase CdaA [Deltaproteobacteria bacterium]|nr:diadenylate cyclase CdaA [Deltaproteobacteria bacterium]